MTDRPSIVNDEHLEYLDDLRESGVTNMFGGGAYLMDEFNLSSNDAHDILGYWMESFSERHSPESYDADASAPVTVGPPE